tara:strand:- start:685 stop:930 length:246 start_codon:yes stop_codon:yes gene_type:complete
MESKSLKNKDIYPMDSDDVWFVCDKCGTPYNDHLEEIVSPELIRGTIEWANTPTKDEDRWDALIKLNIREEYEAKKRKSEG